MLKKTSILGIVRVLPFVILSTVSLLVAAGISAPRKPFYLDMSLSMNAVIDSLGKVSHWKATGLVFVLAWLAVGSRRLPLALGLTLGVGFGWELLEATAVGHTGRLSDLAPDFAAASCAFFVALLHRRLWSKRARVQTQNG